MSKEYPDIDAGRLLFGLSRIGYTTSSAICDIIDNSVRAQASNIHLLIRKEDESYADSKKNNVKEYIVVDDGIGMDQDGIRSALMLGSSDEQYEAEALSKFGLGLKSASFSQGNKLEIISSNGDNGFIKYYVSLPEIMSEKRYSIHLDDLNALDNELIGRYLGIGRGTIVRITEIRKNNHPSVRNTFRELKTKIGVIYYYFIKEGLNINLKGASMSAIDPLFTQEADVNGNLDENEWDGTKVKWIERSTSLTLDDENDITATLEVTQLPYPPRFRMDNNLSQSDSEIRDKYLIGANNYGFYVYRNKRLISWATRLDGVIPYDQDYYAFRGRINFDDSADDFFNIDVKKSHITLSEEALDVILDVTREPKNKSKEAWKNAGKIVNEIVNQSPNEIANKIVEEFEQIDTLPGDQPDSEVTLERTRQIASEMQGNILKFAKLMKEDQGIEIPEDYEFSQAEINEAIRGNESEDLSKIFRVTSVIDNLLWEPYYDTSLGGCVRINKHHRFAELIYSNNSKNQELQILFDLLMLELAQAEMYARKNIQDSTYEEVSRIVMEFRRFISEFLASMCRRLEDQLPPNQSVTRYDQV